MSSRNRPRGRRGGANAHRFEPSEFPHARQHLQARVRELSPQEMQARLAARSTPQDADDTRQAVEAVRSANGCSVCGQTRGLIAAKRPNGRFTALCRAHFTPAGAI